MNKKLLQKIIEEKELQLEEGKVTKLWFIKKGMDSTAKEQEESIKELEEFIKFLKEQL